MNTIVNKTSAPLAEQADSPAVRHTFRQEVGDLFKMLLLYSAVSGVIIAMSIHRYVS
ncbi:MAG: hypothetical protein IAF00_09470 [Phycisphaerales bacterium]|nr:hypothetical protein [Phycisphaerales bacterium]